MDNNFFPFLSGFNLLSCIYMVTKIIDDVKNEKNKMERDYETWLMIVTEEKR